MSDPLHPNIVFIVGDNVGWGDIGCYDGLAPTPRIENDEGRISLPREHQRSDRQATVAIFDLIDDPGEEWDLIEKRLDCAWVLAPVAERLGALQQSMARYPNIKPGREFTGYS